MYVKASKYVAFMPVLLLNFTFIMCCIYFMYAAVQCAVLGNEGTYTNLQDAYNRWILGYNFIQIGLCHCASNVR